MNGKVLLLAPSFMELYNDIIEALSKKGFYVAWVEDDQIPGNPMRKLDRNNKSPEVYNIEVTNFWDKYFTDKGNEKSFDYFIAIDGLMAHEKLFERLKQNNPHIKSSLYLFDRIDGVYEVDKLFKYYDNIFSFDISDCNKYNLFHLPIYWVDTAVGDDTYDIFGFASYSSFKPERTEVFRKVKQISDNLNLNSFVKLYQNDYGNRYSYNIKRFIKKLQGRALELPSLYNDLITTTHLQPSDFREKIATSRFILDTQASYQDGLTARFMWALGANKKILTTNKYVKEYDFYTPEMIFVIDDNYNELETFILTDKFTKYNDIIKRYRIDNWLDTLLKFD